jgi:hypothetical protein
VLLDMADVTTKYANLRKALRKEDFDRALKLANECTSDRYRRSMFVRRTRVRSLLAPYTPPTSPVTQVVDEEDNDLDKTKCVCYIHLAEYDEAIKIAKELGLTFEHAYCCYRLNQVEGGRGRPRATLKSAHHHDAANR